MDYADQRQIILELNEKNKDGYYPLSKSIDKKNIEMVKLLIEYANQHQIIFELNEKDKDGYYPQYMAIIPKENLSVYVDNVLKRIIS